MVGSQLPNGAPTHALTHSPTHIYPHQPTHAHTHSPNLIRSELIRALRKHPVLAQDLGLNTSSVSDGDGSKDAFLELFGSIDTDQDGEMSLSELERWLD